MKENSMGKFTQKLADKITALIEEDNYTITEICHIVGVSRKMFYAWKNTKPAFAQALEEAEDAREEKLRQKARQSMRRKLEGYKQVETKITYVASKDSNDPYALVVKEYVVKEKYCEPETSAIVHSLSGGRNTVSKDKKQPSRPSPLVITVDKEKVVHDLERLRRKLSS